jgi:hypothetical protein
MLWPCGLYLGHTNAEHLQNIAAMQSADNCKSQAVTLLDRENADLVGAINLL